MGEAEKQKDLKKYKTLKKNPQEYLGTIDIKKGFMKHYPFNSANRRQENYSLERMKQRVCDI